MTQPIPLTLKQILCTIRLNIHTYKSHSIVILWPTVCRRSTFNFQGPVVQSIDSSTKSFIEDLLSLSVFTKSIAAIFFAEKL